MVVRDVLTPDQCTATIDDIWSYIETKGFIWNKKTNEPITNPIKRMTQVSGTMGGPQGNLAGKTD